MGELTNKQLRLIELMASGENIAFSARRLSVSRKTIYNWLEIEGVKQLIREKTSDNLLKLGKRVIHVLNKNLEQIQGIFDGKRATITERLRAYSMLLTNVRGLCELGDLNERLTALENKALNNG